MIDILALLVYIPAIVMVFIQMYTNKKEEVFIIACIIKLIFLIGGAIMHIYELYKNKPYPGDTRKWTPQCDFMLMLVIASTVLLLVEFFFQINN